jgi:AAA family ATP:ADP antiporter
LLGICAYLLLHTAASTFLYFEQGRIVAESLTDTVSRTRYFAAVDFSVSSLTLALQVFLTGRLMKRFGLVLCLAILPVVTVAAFGALALAPTLLVLALVQVARRALDYAIARPAREVLFTVVSRKRNTRRKTPLRRWCTVEAMRSVAGCLRRCLQSVSGWEALLWLPCL